MDLSILPPLQPLALPPFTSILITGSLPSSAALHLAISHLSDPATSKRVPEESTAIFSPSPDLYETERGPGERLSVDDWIESHGLHGEYAHKLTRTHILCAIRLSSIYLSLHRTPTAQSQRRTNSPPIWHYGTVPSPQPYPANRCATLGSTPLRRPSSSFIISRSSSLRRHPKETETLFSVT
jgi:hypothetical protein